MHLNEISPAPGSTKPARRHGRGIGSGLGKTGGSGVKGQTSRGKGKVRRLPKFGFTNLASLKVAEVRLSEIAYVEGDVVTLDALKAANIVRKDMTSARIILSGDVTRALTIKGLKVTKGARAAIEAAGGKVEE